MNKCENCEIKFKNNGSYQRHVNSCNLTKSIISEYLSGISISKLSRIYNKGFSSIKNYLIKNNIKIRNASESISLEQKLNPRRHTNEIKNQMSINKRNFYKNNPNKHPWKNNNKFISKPCENFKKILKEMGIFYIEEFTISNDRYFSIDIAIPQVKIAIEINGNQHYEKNGKLKSYYQNRHDFISSLGWNIHEIHFSICFNNDKIIEVVKNLICNKEIFDFNYEKYLLDKLNKFPNYGKSKKCECGKPIYPKSKKCIDCFKKKLPKSGQTVDVLIKEVSEIGYRAVGKKYGVSDNTIRKQINRGYNKK